MSQMTTDELKALFATVVNDAVAPLKAQITALQDSAEEAAKDEAAEVKKEEDKAAEAAAKEAKDDDKPVTNDTAFNPETDEAEETGQNSEIAELKAKIAALEKAAAPKEAISDEEEAAIADAQCHADSVYQMHGQRAPKPMERETLLAYRKRLAKGLQKFSDSQKSVSLAAINDSQYLDYVTREIYSDAAAKARAGITLRRGLQRVEKRGAMGQTYYEYTGDIGSWMADSSLPVRAGRLRVDTRKFVW
ncbi:hypothetical protein [Burkholderia gladioli]|uniref:hypothetical protein n=1 Tax=Burkholderia gladioli TaxID=28095 RepID=UPI003D1FC9C7